MMNHPGYVPPHQQPEQPNPTGAYAEQRGAAGYPGQGAQGPYSQYDWRYAQQPAYRAGYDTSYGRPPIPNGGGAPPTRSRTGALVLGAVAIAVMSGATGGVVGSALHSGHKPIAAGSHLPGLQSPGVPAAVSLPDGSVEKVAAKVVPSVVMLETDLGRQSEEGSGIILTADGMILTNNHVVAAAARAEATSKAPPKTTVTFADGTTAPFRSEER